MRVGRELGSCLRRRHRRRPAGSTDCSFALKHYPNFSAGLFEGVVDYADENPNSRGGFASFRTKADEKERRLGAYQALEMRIKTDGRP